MIILKASNFFEVLTSTLPIAISEAIRRFVIVHGETEEERDAKANSIGCLVEIDSLLSSSDKSPIDLIREEMHASRKPKQ
jgi:hypothetical protein